MLRERADRIGSRARSPRALALALVVSTFVWTACASPQAGANAEAGDDADGEIRVESPELAEATFAGGCFWCMEPPFDRLEGVEATVSGYTGGHVEDPSYEAVSAGGTGHAEAVRVLYDPERISYEELLEVFWRNVDPTDAGGQFCDRGSQYRTGIFVHTPEQRRAAEASRRALVEQEPFEIVTPIEEAGPFYPAEAYHQDFYEKNPIRYTTYRRGCGRDARLAELWGEAAGH